MRVDRVLVDRGDIAWDEIRFGFEVAKAQVLAEESERVGFLLAGHLLSGHQLAGAADLCVMGPGS